MRLFFRRAHGIERDELRRRVEGRVEFWSRRHPHLRIESHYEWESAHDATASYRGGHGTLRLRDDSLEIDLELPAFARVVRGRIEDFVESELREVLG